MKKFVSILAFVFSLLLALPTYAAESFFDKGDIWWHKATPEDVEYLIKQGADVNTRYERGQTPLMIVTLFNKNEAVTETLIKYGADVNARDEIGWTALMSAAQNQNEKIIETLIKNGADINAKNQGGRTALMTAIKFNQNLRVIEILLKNGSDVNARDTMIGWTALIEAVHSENPAKAEILINHGADVKPRDEIGKTALDYAKENPKIYRTDLYWKLNDLMYK